MKTGDRKLQELDDHLNDAVPKLQKRIKRHIVEYRNSIPNEALTGMARINPDIQGLYETLYDDVLAPEIERSYKVGCFGRVSPDEYVRRRRSIIEPMIKSQKRGIVNARMILKAGHGEIDPDMIRPLFGLTETQAKAVANYEVRLISKGLFRRALDYMDKLLSGRTVDIAETEAAEAYNTGNEEGIREARSNNEIDDYYKVWITERDEQVCPICKPLESVIVEMGMSFPRVGVKKPPAHTKCRCTVRYISNMTNREIRLDEL